MTKHYEIYTQQVERQRLVKITCDRCGIELPDPTMFEVRDFELSFATGDSYPEGGSKEGWQVEDLCNACVKWLKKLLAENGIKISDTYDCW